MLDANMRYIQIGERFFADVLNISAGDGIDWRGLTTGDVVLCTMLSEDNNNPIVSMKIKDEFIKVSDKGTGYSWFAYAGKPNGKGFISDTSKEKALSILNNGWVK